MANHKSALKRIRQDRKKNLHNRYFAKTMRNAIVALRKTEDAKEASGKLPTVISMIDRLEKRNVIHKSKASNLKSKLTKHVNNLEAAK
mgnify:CR=1 FL=1